MHVLNVSLKHIIGGTPQVCLDYSIALSKKNVNVTALVRSDDPMFTRHKAAGVQAIKAKFAGRFGSYDPFAILYFIYILHKVKPDVIIAHDGRAVRLLKLASFGRIPIIDVNHGRSVKQSKYTDASIVINPRQEDKTRTFLQKKHVAYIPNMVDIADGVNLKKRDWHTPPVIGALGRFVEEKAFDVFIDALVILRDENVAFKALLGGDGVLRTEIEEKISHYNLSDNITLCGWVNDTNEFYKEIDIFCLSSRREACPKVLLEAMKNNLPCVTSDAEGPVDIITNGYDGIMVENENPRSFAIALKTLIKDKILADDIAKNAVTTIQSKYSIEIIGDKLLHLLKQLVLKEKNI